MFSTTSVVEFDILDRNFNFHRGFIIVKCPPYSENHRPTALQEKWMRVAFGDVKEFRFGEPSKSDSSPEIWKITGLVELQEMMDLGHAALKSVYSITFK